MTTETSTTTDQPITDDELGAIKARYDNATGGAWHFSSDGPSPYFMVSEHHGYEQGIGDLAMFGDGEHADADRDFVVHAKQDMAALLDEIDRLRTAVQQVWFYADDDEGGSEHAFPDLATAQTAAIYDLINTDDDVYDRDLFTWREHTFPASGRTTWLLDYKGTYTGWSVDPCTVAASAVSP